MEKKGEGNVKKYTNNDLDSLSMDKTTPCPSIRFAAQLQKARTCSHTRFPHWLTWRSRSKIQN